MVGGWDGSLTPCARQAEFRLTRTQAGAADVDIVSGPADMSAPASVGYAAHSSRSSEVPPSWRQTTEPKAHVGQKQSLASVCFQLSCSPEVGTREFE